MLGARGSPLPRAPPRQHKVNTFDKCKQLIESHWKAVDDGSYVEADSWDDLGKKLDALTKPILTSVVERTRGWDDYTPTDRDRIRKETIIEKLVEWFKNCPVA